MKPLRSFGLVLAFSVFASSPAWAETDLRDGEALAHLPNNTLVTLAYFRHVSTSDSQSFSESIANFRAVFVMKFGNLAIVPFDAYLPIADVSVCSPEIVTEPNIQRWVREAASSGATVPSVTRGPAASVTCVRALRSCDQVPRRTSVFVLLDVAAGRKS